MYYGLFRALWISSTASHIGSYMTDVGQGWLMSSLTPSPLIVPAPTFNDAVGLHRLIDRIEAAARQGQRVSAQEPNRALPTI